MSIPGINAVIDRHDKLDATKTMQTMVDIIVSGYCSAMPGLFTSRQSGDNYFMDFFDCRCGSQPFCYTFMLRSPLFQMIFEEKMFLILKII